MRLVVRALVVCLLACVGVGCWSAGVSVAYAAGVPGASLGALVSGVGVLGGGLVVPGVQVLDEEQQVLDAREARWSSPGAVVGREVSRTAYRGLSARQAMRVAAQAFPGVVDEEAGGPPRLPAGQRIVGYPADDAARVALPGGKHGLILSTLPMAMAVAGSHGRRVALDLGLTGVGAGFVARTALVGVRIPRRVGEGVVLSRSGVSLTPVDAQGSPLGGSEGALEGAAVLFANTQTDSDTVAKPTTGGFELDSLLRSPESPQQLYFRVGLPAGARLVRARGSSGVRVVDGGVVLAVVSAPVALDAEGRPLPLSISVAGDVLRLTVDHRSGDYRYPIDVDPTVEENVGGKGEILYGTTWGFYTETPSVFKASELPSYENPEAKYPGVVDEISYTAEAGEHAEFYYRTQGESKIYSLAATTSFSYSQYDEENPSHFENLLGILNVHGGGLEAEQTWIGHYGKTTTTLCTAGGCAPGSVTSANDESEAVFMQNARETWDWCPNCEYNGYSKLFNAKVGIVQEAGPSARWDTEAKLPPGIENKLFPGRWVNGEEGFVGLEASDPGTGVLRESWSSPNAPGWHWEHVNGSISGIVQAPECEEVKCGGEPRLVELGGSFEQDLPDGEDTLVGTVEDAVGLKATATGVVKVDHTAPYGVGLVGLPPNNEVGFGRDRLQVSATDGSGSTPSSGIALIRLYIDGNEVGGPSGSCSPGPCTATGEWVINGEDYAAGKHKVVMEAVSGDGLTARPESTITFVSSESKRVGPGSVDLASGAFTLDATDVAVASPGTSLSVERSYDSRLVTAGTEGPLGPQWQGLSFGGNEQLTKLATGSVILTASSGQHAIFTREGSSFLPPTGDANLTLKEESAGAFTLSDQHGDVTRFTVPEGGSGTVLTPASREEPGHAGTATYRFQTVNGVTEPTLALAPVPAGVSCATLVRGCRALTFSYATSTKAEGGGPIGEGASEWGEYKGRLSKVYFTAWEPIKGEMSQPTAVAQYSYDKLGRLRAEWNPQIAPVLKSTYGYDSEGHITAVTPPGQQPWLLHYGTSEGDPTSGRLLSVTRPPASTPLAQHLAPVDEEAPKLSSTSPAVGSELSVSPGAWSNDPLAYSYQWERCSSTGTECTAIGGATNQTYTPRLGDDEGSTLAVLVTATNSGGAATAASATSAPIPVTPTGDFPRKYGGSFGSPGTKTGEFKSPSYIAFSNGENQLYVTDTGNNRVEEFGTGGGYDGELGKAGSGREEFEQPTGIAALNDRWDELWIVDSGNSRIVRYNDYEHSEGLRQYREAEADLPGLGGAGADENRQAAFVVDDTNDSVYCWPSSFYFECGKAFGSAGTGDGQFSDPADVAVNPVNHDIYVLDAGNDRVEYFSEGGCACIEPYQASEYLGQFGEAGSKLGQFKEPKGIAVDQWGHVWVADTGNDRIEEFTATGEPMLELGGPVEKIAEKPKETTKEKKERVVKEESEPERFNRPIGITFDPEGALYVVDSGDSRVKWWYAPERPAEPALPGATPPTTGGDAAWTIDYEVPVTGSDAPYADTEEQIPLSREAVQGTAFFPPDNRWDGRRKTTSARATTLPGLQRPHRQRRHPRRRHQRNRVQRRERHCADDQPRRTWDKI